MPPADDTPQIDSITSQHLVLSPGRQALTKALRDCLEGSSVGSFHRCLRDYQDDVAEWIDSDLRDHFHKLWQEKGQLPERRPYVDSLLKEHKNLVTGVWCEVCREVERGCQHRQRYVDLVPLGQGGFGEVVKARDTQIDRIVAIKYGHDPNRGEADLAEVRTAAALTGEGFVAIYDVLLTSTGRPAIVMEWVDSPTLAKAIKDHPGRWSLRRACTILVSLLVALEKVHAKGIVHNDLKPANLFLNDNDTVRISDFGGATKIGARGGQHTDVYMAPELFNDQPNTIKTDLYSAACIAYELLTGKRCHETKRHGGTFDDPQSLRPDLPHTLAEALRAGLDRDSNKRPASAAAFARPFQQYLQGLPALPSADDHHLGPPPPRCFGRDDFIDREVTEICRNLGSPRRARLYHGPGGIGKSTVAQWIARDSRLDESFGPERYHVVLDGVSSADGVAGKLADAFGLQGADRLHQLDLRLHAPVHRLILLETVDDPLAEAGPNVAALLQHWAECPGVTLLMTSRPDRAPTGDWLVKQRVAPMPDPGLAQIFHDVSGGKHRSDPRLHDVLALANGMPLAAKLLGWFSLECDSLADVLSVWEKQGVRILHHSDTDRSLSVAGTVALSLGRRELQQSKPAQRLLRLLAELPAGLLVTDLHELLLDDADEALRVVRAVGGLADEADGRVSMLAPIREEVRRQIQLDTGDWHRTIRVYAKWLRVQGPAYFHGNAVPLPKFQAERTNFELLLRAGIDAGIVETVYGTWGLSMFGRRLGIDYQRILRAAAQLGKEKGERRGAAHCYLKIADILHGQGQIDEALLTYRKEVLPVYEKLGDVWAKAVTMGAIAAVLLTQGQLDEALRIRREEVLPVYEQWGDVGAKAEVIGLIADILCDQGQIEEALRIYREEVLPVHEQLGDERAKALTMGRIADVLRNQGQLDEALRIRREEELPVYEQLGDVREKTLTTAKIADILHDQGQIDEALRIRRKEVLPVFERLRLLRFQIICRVKIGRDLFLRGMPADLPEARQHLEWALAEARRLRLPEVSEIQNILDRVMDH